jgi:hypothetical protein
VLPTARRTNDTGTITDRAFRTGVHRRHHQGSDGTSRRRRRRTPSPPDGVERDVRSRPSSARAPRVIPHGRTVANVEHRSIHVAAIGWPGRSRRLIGRSDHGPTGEPHDQD